MKMAKASTADIEMAMELSRFVEDLVDGMCPKQACADPASDDIEWLEDDPDQQHIKIITALQDIARKGSIFRVTFGMSVLIDPRNELVDPDADTLEPHPKIGILADQVEALTAERDEWKARCEFSFEQRDKLTAERDALKDAARLALVALVESDPHPDDANYEDAVEAIAALKAVL